MKQYEEAGVILSSSHYYDNKGRDWKESICLPNKFPFITQAQTQTKAQRQTALQANNSGKVLVKKHLHILHLVRNYKFNFPPRLNWKRRNLYFWIWSSVNQTRISMSFRSCHKHKTDALMFPRSCGSAVVKLQWCITVCVEATLPLRIRIVMTRIVVQSAPKHNPEPWIPCLLCVVTAVVLVLGLTLRCGCYVAAAPEPWPRITLNGKKKGDWKKNVLTRLGFSPSKAISCHSLTLVTQLHILYLKGRKTCLKDSLTCG